MKDYDDMTPAEREAWFAERLQQQHNDTVDDQSAERLWVGLGIMGLVVISVLALNAFLRTQGYGA